MNRVREIGIMLWGVRYSIGGWWRPKGSAFNQFEVWRVSKKRPRYLSAGVSLWRLAIEFSAIERRTA